MGSNPFKKVGRAIKKVAKGIGKAIKKVVKGVAKVGKKIFKTVGKVMNKLGPIGMIAVGLLMPAAIGWMAVQEGAIGAIGTGLQAVGAAVSAPFKMLGQAVGKGVATVGGKVGAGISNMGAQSLGDAVATTASKIGNVLGYKGGTLSEGMQAIKTDVAVKWDNAFGTSYAPQGELAKYQTTLNMEKAAISLPEASPVARQDPITGEWRYDVTAGGESPLNIPAGETLPQMSPVAQYDPISKTYSQTATAGLESALPSIPGAIPVEGESLTSKVAKSAAKSLLGGGAGTSGEGIPRPDLDKSSLPISAVGATSPFGVYGAGGKSFYGQEYTGLLSTEELIRQQQSLLSRRYA